MLIFSHFVIHLSLLHSVRFSYASPSTSASGALHRVAPPLHLTARDASSLPLAARDAPSITLWAGDAPPIPSSAGDAPPLPAEE